MADMAAVIVGCLPVVVCDQVGRLGSVESGVAVGRSGGSGKRSMGGCSKVCPC